jgi:hypothetical protein
MSESEFHPAHPLPAELELALNDATTRAFASLATLRKALRDHVCAERGSGQTLVEIEAGLRTLVARTEDKSPQDADDEQRRRPGLVDQVLKWSESFFVQAD